MAIFKTDRPNTIKNIILTWGLFSLIVITIILCVTFFKSKPLNNSFYFITGAILLMRFIDETRKDRFYEINIDKDKKQIVFSFKSLFSEKQQKVLSFDNARIEIIRTKASWLLLRSESLKLYFLKNKMEICELDNSKDGFSIESLNLICKTLEENSLPTTIS